MLAFSVREALRAAVAAFGEPGREVDLNSPATPEAIYWAIEAARRGDVVPVAEGMPADDSADLASLARV